MEAVKRIQALARMAIALSLGALMIGFIAVLLSWIAPDESAKSVPLLLLAPGLALLIAGIALIVRALRTQPDTWQETYRGCAKFLQVLAIITCIAIVVLFALTIIFWKNTNFSQLFLVALIGLQAPLVLLTTARHMQRAVCA
ncbi:MAG: hypothetical protein IKZ87_03880 [Actinomycetaceae bacterium]|nr:hypothetical protein [Actinomycetaceae bacterium]